MVGDNYRHTVSANKTLITGTPGTTTTRITLAALCTVSCLNRVHTDFQNFRNLATRHLKLVVLLALLLNRFPTFPSPNIKVSWKALLHPKYPILSLYYLCKWIFCDMLHILCTCLFQNYHIHRSLAT